MTKHSGDTNKIKEVKLTSTIEQVSWSQPRAVAGSKIGIDVFTKYVGNNSDIKIEIKDKNGKSGGTTKGKISGNRFWKNIDIPDNLKDELTATVKLSKHGLEKKSNTIPLLPPIKISNLKWDKDEAKRGDILKITADVKGAYDGAETTIEIYEHDSDGAHDLVTSFPALVKSQKIKTEWEFQYVEDTDDIPDDNESENGYQNPEYFFRVNIGGISEDSGLLKFKDTIEVQWNNSNEPAANNKFKIVTADGNEINGSLDTDGKFNADNLPPGPFILVLEDDEDADSDSNENSNEEKEIKIVLKDHEENKYSNKKFELRFGQKVLSGNTDGNGKIQVKIPSNVLQAKLMVWLRDGEEKASYTTLLQLQDFDEDDGISSVQARLQNLGFYAGSINSENIKLTKEAIKNFQRKNNLPVTGEIDSELTSKISDKFKNR